MHYHEETGTVEPREQTIGDMCDDQAHVSCADVSDLPDDTINVDDEDDD